MTHSDEPIQAIFGNDPSPIIEFSGLTKREYFAAMAMQGLLANTDIVQCRAAGIPALSVDYAYALTNALNTERCRQCNLPTSDNHYDKEHDLCSIVGRAK